MKILRVVVASLLLFSFSLLSVSTARADDYGQRLIQTDENIAYILNRMLHPEEVSYGFTLGWLKGKEPSELVQKKISELMRKPSGQDVHLKMHVANFLRMTDNRLYSLFYLCDSSTRKYFIEKFKHEAESLELDQQQKEKLLKIVYLADLTRSLGALRTMPLFRSYPWRGSAWGAAGMGGVAGAVVLIVYYLFGVPLEFKPIAAYAAFFAVVGFPLGYFHVDTYAENKDWTALAAHVNELSQNLVALNHVELARHNSFYNLSKRLSELPALTNSNLMHLPDDIKARFCQISLNPPVL